MDDNYTGLKYHGEYYSKEDDYKKAIEIINSFNYTSFDIPVNTVFELETAKRIIESKGIEEKYGKEVAEKNKKACAPILPFIAKWFSKITDKLFLQSVDKIYVGYFDYFLEYFNQFKAYEKVSDIAFSEYLNRPDTTLHKLLKHSNIVNHYDVVIADYMCESEQTIGILASVFLEDSKESYYLPKHFLPTKFEAIFQKYINSEQVNPNLLQLIFDGRDKQECPISDKVKLAARKRYSEYWHNHSEKTTSYGYGVSVSFSDVDTTKINLEDGNVYHLTYDIKWLEENLDYPTILNNFIYVFELFDLQFCPSFVSVASKISTMEGIFMVKGKDCYKKGHQFVISNMLASSQIGLYYQFLKSKGIELEKVFQWFFEIYLKDEFGANGFTFTPSSENTSYLEKIRNIASEMDGVLKQYNMFVRDGVIDRELYEMSSEHIVYSNVTSQLKSKYGYIDDSFINTAMFYLFSDQSLLSYTEKTKEKYSDFFNLIKNEEMFYDDFNELQKEKIDWLVSNEYLSIGSYGKLSFCQRKVFHLKRYYDNDVICLKYVENAGIYFNKIRILNTLFSEPEQSYLNYMLNKSVYSDGKDLRNKYIHSTYPRDEETQKTDYIEFLKIMILVIVKINEEFCIKELEEGNRKQ